MPLFTGRVGALSHHYSVPRSAYHDPSQDISLIFFNESSLSKLKLAYDPKSPLKTYTLWEYALKNANSFVMPSLTNLKRKIGQALEMTVREDEAFWDALHATGDKIIIFENPHWFLGRHRPGNGEYWSGRNELGDLLVLVRDSYRGSLARFMPLQAFPLSSPALSSTSPGTLEIGRRPLAASSPSGQRPLSITSMDLLPSGPFSRLVRPGGNIEGCSSASFSPLLNHQTSGTIGDTRLPSLGEIGSGSSLLHNLPSVRPTSLSLRSPRSSISSSGFSPPPPYTSNPTSLIGSPAFDFSLLDSNGPLPRLNVGSSYRPRSDPAPINRNAYLQQAQTLPRRLRVAPVTEDSERQALNQIRENYYQDINRNRLSSDNDIDILRNTNLRRMNRQEIADVQRQMREAERVKAIAEIRLARRNHKQPQSNTGAVVKPALSQSLERADELGAQRAREIEGKIVAHRRAMRDAQDRRREREFEEIERLAGADRRFVMAVNDKSGLVRDRRYSMPPI